MKNQVVISGNVGENPQIFRKPGSHASVLRLSIAYSDYRYIEESNTYEKIRTNWVPVVSFGPLAHRAGEVLKKGSYVTVFGKLRSSTYQSGDKKQAKLELVADDILMSEKLPISNQEAFKKLSAQIESYSDENDSNDHMIDHSLDSDPVL